MYSAASSSPPPPPPLLSPPRRDFISVTLSGGQFQPAGGGGGGYNNSKAWRRRSCWRKWKQLSRLQRSIILFLFAFLVVCGIKTYANMADPWKSATSRSSEEQKADLEIPGLNPANQAILPIPQKADASLRDFSPQKPLKQIPARRGPPNLQIRPPWRETEANRAEGKPGQADQAHNLDKPVISRRGPLIEPNPSPEPPSRKISPPGRPSAVASEDPKEPGSGQGPA
ncbi:endoplasmic reticulum mannosyl-oligosaccharide 1,2-alpha-mannosidase-like [Protobothrops mucrosquamatus]|uniref:endoplasmic reticulum mannosyl-oligosaccharide 1,2-alpha-mannosidase-like n=1 Tax=Protobothrops mucrosquamatus TaxID=103944 RepID=UPI0010FAE3E4|nr:endoplasmic reticulum mannosyl-oligosaccharide 1,2-alpha-mannosidase-like [Protobothrops mucrosquamatus]